MLKNSILTITLALVLSACAWDKPQLTGVDGSAIPAAFAHFPDVPFPEQSYIDLDETRALGSGENWIGTVVFTAPYNASGVYDFYVSEMPKLNWSEVATVRAKISHMTYVRQNRAIQVLIEIKDSDNALVTITAIPNAGGFTPSESNRSI